YGE
ncbi:Protein of unknown function, partial [Gryllus bimaculatus]